MVNRKELEGLVALAIEEIRLAERRLEQRYRSLGKADATNRVSFIESLNDLGQRATQLELLVDQLDSYGQTQELSAA
jgi:hypothetical protein